MKKTKKVIAAALCAAVTLSSIPFSLTADAADATVKDSGLDIDYARAFQYSVYFYDANMCGEEVGEHTLLSDRKSVV